MLGGGDYEHRQVQNMLVGGGFWRREECPCSTMRRCWPMGPCAGEGEAHPAGNPSSFTPSATALTWTSPWAAMKLAHSGRRASVVSDTGAFASLGGPVLGGPAPRRRPLSRLREFRDRGPRLLYQQPPAGAFRFGVTQTCFCTETLLNEWLGSEVGISPWGDHVTATPSAAVCCLTARSWTIPTGLVETLEAIKPAHDEAAQNGDPVGIACAMKNAGVGVGYS